MNILPVLMEHFNLQEPEKALYNTTGDLLVNSIFLTTRLSALASVGSIMYFAELKPGASTVIEYFSLSNMGNE